MAGTFSQLTYHVVFSTKGRERLLTDDVADRVYRYLGGTLRRLGGDLVEIGGVSDHVHLLVRLEPRHALADVMRAVKASSSRWIREERIVRGFSWQRGYAVFTVSESQIPRVRRYLHGQAEHHRKKTFREELVELLDAHGVAYEERYLD